MVLHGTNGSGLTDVWPLRQNASLNGFVLAVQLAHVLPRLPPRRVLELLECLPLVGADVRHLRIRPLRRARSRGDLAAIREDPAGVADERARLRVHGLLVAHGVAVAQQPHRDALRELLDHVFPRLVLGPHHLPHRLFPEGCAVIAPQGDGIVDGAALDPPGCHVAGWVLGAELGGRMKPVSPWNTMYDSRRIVQVEAGSTEQLAEERLHL